MLISQEGGASALTAAEIREARAQADAEFEKERKQPKKRYSGPLRAKDKGPGEEDVLLTGGVTGNLPKSVEMLRYKSLCVGMKIWGAIAEINNKDLVVSLPGGLRGFVLAEEASDVLFKNNVKASKKVKKRRKNEEVPLMENDGHLVGGNDEENEVSPLMELFIVGQLVACTVLKLELAKGKQEKKGRRIELSLRLGYLHEGLMIDAVHEGQVMTATVVSVEDHGYLLSFGVSVMSGFLLHRNYMDGEEAPKLRKGQLVQGVVTSVDKKRGTVTLKSTPSLVASNTVKEYAGLTLELLMPGSLVNVRVRAIMNNGVLLSFLTYFSGTVDIFHLEDPLPGPKWSEKYSVNQRLKARILFVNPVTKSVGLTLNPQLLRYTAPSLAVEVGDVFEKAVVRRVDPTIGLLLELPCKDSAAAAYVHISNVSDEHVAKLEKIYKEGKKVRSRVIGFRIMDALAIASLKESVVEQLLLGYADVKPAMVVRGTVANVEPYGAFIQLADGLRALCPLQHMSEFPRVAPSAKFQVGVRMKFRVLTCDLQAKKISLTHKKIMVTSKLTPVTSYDDAVEGLVTHGYITGIEEYGCFVSFYNDVKGLAHRTELGIDAGVKADTVFHVGQSIKCRVIRSDPSSSRLSLSFVTSSLRDKGIQGAGKEVKPGIILSGTVAHVGADGIMLDVPTAKGVMKGVLSFPHLADSVGHVEQLRGVMKIGLKFDRLLVLEITEKQKLIISAKYSLLQAVASLPSDVSQLQVQAIIPGYIANITERGCFVRFLGRLTGLASIPQVADEFVRDPSNHFSVGQSVRAQVLDVNLETGKFSVCLKQSVCFSTDGSLIQGYFLEEDKIVEGSGVSNLEWTDSLAIGTCVEGEIQEIKDYGVIVSLQSHSDVVGFVTHYQLDRPVEVGKLVQARVLDVVRADGIADLTLRPELFPVTESKILLKKEKTKLKRHNPVLKESVELYQKVSAIVELVKDDYLVLSLPDQGNAIGFASTRDFNSQVVDSHQRYRPGQRLAATVQVLAEEGTGGRMLLLITSDPHVIPSSKKPRRDSTYDVGSVVEAEVVSVEPLGMMVQISKTMQGHVHITQVTDRFEVGNPLNSFMVGQKINAKVLAKSRVKKTSNLSSGEHILELSVRPSQLPDALKADMGSVQSGSLPTLEAISIGQIVTVYVQEVTDEWAWLLLSSRVRGRLFVLDSSTDPAELGRFQDRFKPGTAVRCRVKSVNTEKGTLDFSLRSIDTAMEGGKLDISAIEGHVGCQDSGSGDHDKKEEVKEGDVMGGRVARVYPGVGGLSVQIQLTMFGRVHVTHLDDIWRDNPVSYFKEGQFVRCRVLEFGKSFNGKPQVDLSLRPSLGGSGGIGAILDEAEKRSGRGEANVLWENVDDLKPGLQVEGFVKSASNKGCFLTLARHVDARVLLSNLSDSFVRDPSESFPPGKLVTGRILSAEPLSGRVEVTLKSSPIDASNTATRGVLGRHFADFNVGDVVFGLIKRIEPFGLFVSIDQSNVVGMCHVSEIADHFVKQVEKLYKVGDTVRAVVLKTDAAHDRISLGLKESYFPEPIKEELQSDAGAVNEVEAEARHNIEINGTVTKDTDDSQEEDIATDVETGHQTDTSRVVDEVDGAVSGAESGDEEDSAEEESQLDVIHQEVDMMSRLAPPLEVQLDEELKTAAGPDTDDENFAEEDVTDEAKKLSKRAKKRQKEEREAAIREAEEKRLKGDQAPETIDEFEALVRTSPNSSIVWIKYMAYLLQLADVEKARAIAERALQTINFREEGEKRNVWVALLNLENRYGNPPKEAVLEVFNRALQYCDPKKLYFGLLRVYENPTHPQGPQEAMADQLLKTMTRKFKTSAKVWLMQIQSLLARGVGDTAHKALDQALLSLPRRKHIKVITHVAIIEFRIGSAERARTMFDGVLRNYPKRTDLWSVYLDQEIRLGESTVVRALFERVICLDLPARKMKFLFKKYLDYEKAHGDEARVEHVKTKAMEYVDSKLG